MRNCSNCKNLMICKIYDEISEGMNNGLKTQVLTPKDNGTTTFSHQAIISGLARSCNRYEAFNVELYLGDSLPEIEDLVKVLKNDEEFIQEFLNSPSPEHRAQLIQTTLDEDEILDIIKNLPNPEDHLEDIENYILSKFGL